MAENPDSTKTKRVVVTGMAAVTPFGIGVDTLWENLVNGKSGICRLSNLDAFEFPIKIGGPIPHINFEEYLPGLNVSKNDRYTNLGLMTAGMTINDAGIGPEEKDIPVIVGSGFGPVASHEELFSIFAREGWRKIPPASITKSMFNNLPSMISIYHKLTGGNHGLGAACASGTAAIGEAYQMIKLGAERRVLAGGVDTPIIPSVLGAWINMRFVLSRNPNPQAASRPFDKNRNGMVLSEGSALILLEELESAKKRSAKIYGEIIGYGASSDAFDIAIPNSAGQALAIKRALKDANLNPEEVDYINAHGTSTPANDREETKAIKEAFGDYSYKLTVSSNKSMLGHSMGASGAIELMASILSLKNGIIPPTINYDTPDPECDLDYVPNQARSKPIKTAISNSFAFGGNNSVIVLRRYEESDKL